MKVRVRVFAAYREILGKDELELDVPNGTTARGAFESLLGTRADFTRRLRELVNCEPVPAPWRLDPALIR
jgi:molybdopterin converting factor small subunit